MHTACNNNINLENLLWFIGDLKILKLLPNACIIKWNFVFLFYLHFNMMKQIRLDSSNIFMPNLKIVPSQMSGTSSSSAATSPLSSSQNHDHHHQQHHHKIYQLCACSNGKLFLAMSHSICAGDVSTVCS